MVLYAEAGAAGGICQSQDLLEVEKDYL